MNSVSMIGRFVTDPEVKSSTAGNTIVNFRFAVDRPISKEDRAAGKQASDFFTMVAYGKTADTIAAHMTKGRQAGIRGRAQCRQWEQDGQKRSAVEFVVEQMTFISDGQGQGQKPAGGRAAAPSQPNGADPFADE